jgi:subtilisin-like proprotein convertase family protein
MKTVNATRLLVLGSLMFAGACAGSQDEGDYVDAPVLTPLDELFGHLPPATTKATPPPPNAPPPPPNGLPSQWDVVEFQSPVKSQGSRGVCSVFATTAFMEHAYIVEGSLIDPNFSEQYLQWSAKEQVGMFRNTSGSNAYYNLRAISRFGIPEEDAWPYETFQWGAAQDPECGAKDNDQLPTKCYTNGDPPQSALESTLYKLPESISVWAKRDNVKKVMWERGTGVTAGMTFFYQSWNHRLSKLPRNMEYWEQGYVLYPNDEDKRISLEDRVGHAILLVGWDDDLEVQKVDQEGKLMVDAQGNPVMEKGFFIFKNSWGTGSFGKLNPHGDGYGFISQAYIEEYATLNVTNLPSDVPPRVTPTPAEVCDDGVDNSGNELIDCADPACASDDHCAGGLLVEDFTSGAANIPDGDPAGLSYSVQVSRGSIAANVAVAVDIAHGWRGDIELTLTGPNGVTAVLKAADEMDGHDDVVGTFSTNAFNGIPMAGTWTLVVADVFGGTTGTLYGAALEISPGQVHRHDFAITNGEIPDANPDGVSFTVPVPHGKTLSSVSLNVNIAHTFAGDLRIRLQHPDGTSVLVKDVGFDSAASLVRTYTVEGLSGKPAGGTWILTVEDMYELDTGRVNSASLGLSYAN